MSLLRDPPPAEPYLATQESDEEAPHENPTPKKEEKSPSPDLEDSKASSSDDEADNDPELDDLLAENSASESSSDGEDKMDTKSMPPAVKPKSGRHKYERPANTLAVIVLACWTLRIPILYRDLTRCVA